MLISESVYTQLNQSEEKYLIRLIDRVFLKGKSQATRIYEVSSLPAWEFLDAERDYIKLFNTAFKLYERGNFSEAENVFKNCLEHKPEDYVAELLMKRCAGYIVSGMPPGWDGTSLFLEK